MFIDICHYFIWVGCYFLQTGLDEIFVPYKILFKFEILKFINFSHSSYLNV